VNDKNFERSWEIDSSSTNQLDKNIAQRWYLLGVNAERSALEPQITNLQRALEDAADALELEVGENVFKSQYGWIDDVLLGYRR
jgi:hypothetical protein